MKESITLKTTVTVPEPEYFPPKPAGFLSPENIDQNGPIFEYIKELHVLLWAFTRVIFPSASGQVTSKAPQALKKLKIREEIKDLQNRLKSLSREYERN